MSNTGAGLHWQNTLLTAGTFRRAHVETFAVAERVSVLHVCLFPHLHDAAPIFGFDMVAGPARVTGIFLDLSPVTHRPPRPGLRDVVAGAALDSFATRRVLPEWGEIFSPDMLAIRPTDLNEVDHALALAKTALDGVLRATQNGPGVPSAEIVAGQARYAEGQRRNEHTARMLAGFIGAEAARRFIDEVLFPLPAA
jgi:phycocyanobilin:ferredoxin oxidoreductase